MQKKELFSLELERHSLTALVKFPELFNESASWLSEDCFVNNTHNVIYSIIKTEFGQSHKLDKVLLAQKINNLGIKTDDDIDIYSYCDILYSGVITYEGGLDSLKELKKMQIFRGLAENCRTAYKYITNNLNQPLGNVLRELDTINNSKIKEIVHESDEPVDLCSGLEEMIEGIADNPPDDKKFLMGPFPTINKIYGSLLRRGAINLTAARSGIGKTAWGFFYLTHVAEKYNIPILHLDFAEMTKSELQTRAVCCFTHGKVPLHAIETGEWRKNPEYIRLVRSVWAKVKKLKIYYYDIGSLSADQIINLIRRFYYKHIGRDTNEDSDIVKLLINYDYLKPFNFDPRMAEYREMGFFIQKLKKLIIDEISASVWASLQINRSGIITNKTSNQVDDSENSFSLSDRIIQQSTHAWILRHKLDDEIADEECRFGNMKLMNMKHRHLGKDYQGALKPVKVSDGFYKRNYINIQGESFYFEDKGDLNEMVEVMQEKYDISDNKDDDDVRL